MIALPLYSDENFQNTNTDHWEISLIKICSIISRKYSFANMSYFYFYTELDETEIDVMFSPRNEGELKELTERLHSYIAKMRELRNGAPHLDSHNFFKVCLLSCVTKDDSSRRTEPLGGIVQNNFFLIELSHPLI